MAASLRVALAAEAAVEAPGALLDELAGLSAEAIRRRPAQLAASLKGLQAQLASLLDGSAPAFVESADCIKQVHRETVRVSETLTMLENHLPLAAEEATVLLDVIPSIANARERNALLLEQHANVLEVLELPQLMDACVRNGMIDEALELEAAVRAEALMHPDIPIMIQVSQGVSGHVQVLRDQLLAQLCGPLKLPAALSCIGFLRRIPPPDSMSDSELRQTFLKSRNAYFAQAEATLPQDSAASYLLKYLDLCRVHWYDVVTQYRAIFGEDKLAQAGSSGDRGLSRARSAKEISNGSEPGLASVSVKCPYDLTIPLDSSPDKARYAIVTGPTCVARLVRIPDGACPGDDFSISVPIDAIYGAQLADDVCQTERLGCLFLSGWAVDRVELLLATLRKWLLQVQEGTFLTHLMEQCATCGSSLGLVGLDFSPLTRDHFRSAILKLLEDGCLLTTKHWKDSIASYRWNAPLPLPIPNLSTSTAPRSTNFDAPESASKLHPSPPLELLQYPPLAVLLNHYLTVFNELRQCMPFELRPQVFDQVTSSLLEAAACMREVRAREELTHVAADHLRSFCKCMALHLLPYLATALEVLAPQWAPPVEWGRQCAEIDVADDLGKTLVAKVQVMAVLQPIYSSDADSKPEKANEGLVDTGGTESVSGNSTPLLEEPPLQSITPNKVALPASATNNGA